MTRRCRTLVVLSLAAALLVGLPSRPSLADPITVTPNDFLGFVDTTVTDQGNAPKAASRGSRKPKARHDTRVTCSYTPVGIASIGLAEDYGLAEIGGLNPSGMGLHIRSCSDGAFDIVWRNPTNAGAVGGGLTVTPGQLAQVAYSRLRLPRPRARFNPARPSSAGPATVVHLPTWWWVDTWTTRTRRTGAGAVWALVIATPVRTEWNPGNGGRPVVCDGPGLAWRPGLDESASSCTYPYPTSSASEADQRFDATVTVEWDVRWVGSGGTSGALPAMSTAATFPVAVMEWQSVVTGSGGGLE